MGVGTLLEETKAKLKASEVSASDVVGVITEDGWCTWAEFEKISNFYYDSGYGYPEVDMSLKVLGPDWWLERREYDGAEWWEFCRTPTKEGLEHKSKMYIGPFSIEESWK